MNTTRIGDELERDIFDLLEQEIDAGRFFAKRECCKLYRQKGYFSRDRDTNIVFDVTIEISLPGAATYSVLIIIECKKYTHPVPVDDIEEFYAKVQQVGAANSKAILVTTSAFQSGTLAFAKAKGIGLARYFAGANLKRNQRGQASLICVGCRLGFRNASTSTR